MEKNIDKLIFDKEFYKQLQFQTKVEGDFFVSSVETLKLGKQLIIEKHKIDIVETRQSFFDLMVEEKHKIKNFKEDFEIKKLTEKKNKIEEELKKLEIAKNENNKNNTTSNTNSGSSSLSNSPNSIRRFTSNDNDNNRKTTIIDDTININSPISSIDEVNLYIDLSTMYKRNEFCSKDSTKIKNILEKYKHLVN